MDETAKKMNEALKQAGFSRRQVTVRHRRALYDDGYRVTVHDPKVSLLQIEEIAGAFETIRYDEYCGEILAGGNNYVNVDRNEEHPADIDAILPLVEPALRKVLQTGYNQTVVLPTRRYLIGQQQNGCPDLWGQKPESMNRLTGKPYEPEREFDYIAEFMRPDLGDERFMASASRTIARRIAENELDLAYIEREAVQHP